MNFTLRIIVIVVAMFLSSSSYGEERTFQNSTAPVVSLSEAVYRAIETNPWVIIHQESLVQKTGIHQQAVGAFDTVFSSRVSKNREREPLDQTAESLAFVAGQNPPDYFETDTTSYSLGLSKLTRSGLSLNPTLSVTDIDEAFSNEAAHSYASIDFSLNIPLLRDFGREAGAGATELASESELAAARFTTLHNIAGVINDTVVRFWECLANQAKFELRVNSQQRAQTLLDLVGKLVRSGTLEPAAVNQVQANLLGRRIDVRHHQERFYTSRQFLGLGMGLGPDELPEAPKPEGSFPAVMTPEQLGEESIEDHISAALKQRGDYLGAKENILTASILVKKAANLRKPKLDLGLRAGYNGLSEEENSSRYYRALSNKLSGPNYLLSLNFELPFQNNVANGNLVVRQSEFQTARQATRGLSNQVASETLIAFEQLFAAAQEYQLAEQAEAAYLKTVDFETRKYKVGNSTLTAVIDAESRYLDARTVKVDTIRKYAVALTNFRFVTGSLLSQSDDYDRFNSSRLLVFPKIPVKRGS